MKSIAKLMALTAALLLLIGVIVLLVIQLTNQNTLEGLAAISQFFEQQKWTFTVFRVCLLAGLFWQWIPLIHWLARRNNWDDELRVTLIEARWKVLAWFVLFELIVNQNLLGYLL